MSRVLLDMREKEVEMTLWVDVYQRQDRGVISSVRLEKRMVDVSVRHSLQENCVTDV